ncbi:unnamed protein product [Periconia digitata]|uniref:Uncharacterized protein n=1 Tax=Periconia digitata TaxID=1303443 RepID=A0A9W4U7P2_9PLEO|nr:unnamed protein product [Periconia digitata]
MPPAIEHPPQPSSPTHSQIRNAVAGRPNLSASEGGYTGSETPRVNGYSFVDATPPSPEDEDEDEPPTDLLERFGAGSSSSTASPFTIPESQRREKLHHQMVDRISASKRSSSSASNTTSSVSKAPTPHLGLGLFTSEKTPRFTSAPTPAAMREQLAARKLGNLTPAAQRLFQSVGRTPGRAGSAGGGSGGFGDAPGKGGKMWTPTPRTVGGSGGKKGRKA